MHDGGGDKCKPLIGLQSCVRPLAMCEASLRLSCLREFIVFYEGSVIRYALVLLSINMHDMH
jgi:hypothetical protein